MTNTNSLSFTKNKIEDIAFAIMMVIFILFTMSVIGSKFSPLYISQPLVHSVGIAEGWPVAYSFKVWTDTNNKGVYEYTYDYFGFILNFSIFYLLIHLLFILVNSAKDKFLGSNTTTNTSNLVIDFVKRTCVTLILLFLLYVSVQLFFY